MKVFIYKLLTQSIIILGRLREKLGLQESVLRSRTFKNPPDMFYSISCCDCGLIHMRLAENGLEQPIRPRGYDYSWRRFCEEPDVFKSESEWLSEFNKNHDI